MINRKWSVVAAILFFIICLPAYSSTIYVKPTGDDAKSGLSWDLAKKTVQAAMNTSTAGDEVWVAAGNYLECITLKSSVGLYGGFIGSETVKSERNWKANITTLDGGGVGPVVLCGANNIIDGFNIINGTGEGAGIKTYGAVTIANNTFTGHLGYNYDSRGYLVEGSVIFANSGSIVVSHNKIIRNRMSAIKASGVITNNIIEANMGTGISSSGIIVGNIVCGNSYCGISVNSTSTVVNNTITGSQIGIYCSSCVVANNLIMHNTCGADIRSSVQFNNNCVYSNYACNYCYGKDQTGLNGNISVDPKTCGSYHIAFDSPCKNAGDATVVQSGWLDIGGQLIGADGKPDIGADESNGENYPPVIIRVSPDGDDSFDGLTWTTAKRTVQAAIDKVALSSGEVWVKSGQYNECIFLKPYVSVYGGFNGTETERSQRDAAKNVTILDGQKKGSVVTSRGAGYFVSSIDGFTIQNGIGTTMMSYDENGIREKDGAGILCDRGSAVTISNNVITGNSTDYYGGGILTYCSPSIITNNKIIGNSAGGGGGIDCADGPGYSSTMYGSPTITFNTIQNNTSKYDGAGIHAWNCKSVITDNIISGNVSSNGRGGGIHGFYGNPQILRNIITNNSALWGGGIEFQSCSATVSANLISSNSARIGGGTCVDMGTATFTNNIIAGNTASTNGGGVGNWGANRPVYINNTIVGNTSPDGGGIYGESNVVNNIIAFNTSGVSGVNTTATTFANNCVYGNNGADFFGTTPNPTGTNGNISVDPLFINKANGNYHIFSNSFCVDAGTSANAPTSDFDGASRPKDGNGDGISVRYRCLRVFKAN